MLHYNRIDFSEKKFIRQANQKSGIFLSISTFKFQPYTYKH